MRHTLHHIFVGGLQPLPPEGQMSGIVKAPVAGPIALGPEGLAGDRHGDPRYHGGREKALHHYPADHYPHLAEHLPELRGRLVPGALGENLTTTGVTEDAVCVGDVFRIGACRVQVSQPRQPCWKINCLLGEARLSRLIADSGRTGWYYRVLAGGTLAPGDGFELLERPAPGVSLARLWRINLAHRPDPEEVAQLARTPGLSPPWQRKLAERAEWLRRL
jgi:MOSC domain-containing protein YiiM